jgi:hypothetical protein
MSDDDLPVLKIEDITALACDNERIFLSNIHDSYLWELNYKNECKKLMWFISPITALDATDQRIIVGQKDGVLKILTKDLTIIKTIIFGESPFIYNIQSNNKGLIAVHVNELELYMVDNYSVKGPLCSRSPRINLADNYIMYHIKEKKLLKIGILNKDDQVSFSYTIHLKSPLVKSSCNNNFFFLACADGTFQIREWKDGTIHEEYFIKKPPHYLIANDNFAYCFGTKNKVCFFDLQHLKK